jgi:two-component system, NarL family, nitrate/nitrite response regulator NarL
LRKDATVVEGPLTPRQRDILALTAEGLTAREIGDALGITANTVRTHRETSLRRLPARNITHAVAILLRRGEIL